MGIKERREREKQQVRQAILTAAREIAVREGWQAVTIRKVAERIEYSPATIYEHFNSKDTILQELVRQGLQQLLEDLQSARAKEADPRARLLAMAIAYWDFAWKYPELYQVTYGLGGVPFECSDGPEEPINVLGEVRETLVELAAANGVQNQNLDEEVLIVWGTIHGLISLTMAGRMPVGAEMIAPLVKRAMGYLLAGWGAPG